LERGASQSANLTESPLPTSPGAGQGLGGVLGPALVHLGFTQTGVPEPILGLFGIGPSHRLETELR
jgi:hypothetical protein